MGYILINDKHYCKFSNIYLTLSTMHTISFKSVKYTREHNHNYDNMP